MGAFAGQGAAFLGHLRECDVLKTIRLPDRADEGDDRAPVVEYRYGFGQGQNTRTVIDAAGHSTVYTLNAAGNPIRIEEPLGRVTTMTWSVDEHGRDNLPTSRTETVDGSRSRTVRYAYEFDGTGAVTKVTETDPLGHSTITSFEPRFHQPLVRTDRNGNSERWTYDDHGNVLTHVDATQAVWTYTYAPNGLKLTETAPGHAHATTYTYDAYSDPDVVTGPEGSRTDSDYDVRGRLSVARDPLGRVTRFDYDDLDRLIGIHHPDPGVTVPARAEATSSLQLSRDESITYDRLGNKLTETQTSGLTLTYTYTARGQVKTVRRSVGEGVKQLAYDNAGNLVRETDWAGAATSHVYDELNHRTSTRNRLGATATMEYDLAGNLVRETDFAGHVTVRSYDLLDRLIREERLGQEGHLVELAYYDEADPEKNLKETTEHRAPQSPVVTTYQYSRRYERTHKVVSGHPPYVWTYRPDGTLDTTTDELGHVVHYEHDEQGRLRFVRRTVNGRTLTTETRYDAAGNATKVIDAKSHAITSAYDEWNRVVSTTDPLGQTTYVLRDGAGNIVNERDPNGFDHSQIRDALGRVLTVIDGEGNRATFTYDANGNVTLATDARGIRTRTAYDEEDRTIRVTQAEGTPAARTSEVLERDGNGNPLRMRDGNGNVHRIEYNAESRPWRETDPAGATVTRKYLQNGLVYEQTNRVGFTVRTTYDDLNRPHVVTDSLNRTVTTDYDETGHPVRVEDARHFVTVTTYDELSRVTRVDRPTGLLHGYTYDDAGNVVDEEDARSVHTTHAYTDRNELSTTTYADGSVETRTYDDAGNLRTQGRTGHPTTVFTYDGEHRLVSSSTAGEVTTYGYDAAGHRTRITQPEGQAGGVREGQSRVLAYDAIGRVETVTEGGLVSRYGYDANDNLRTVSLAGRGRVEMTYDARDRRTALVQYDAENQPAHTWQYPEYDDEGRLGRAVDPLGQETRYEYDVAGRLRDATYAAPAGPRVSTVAAYASHAHWEYDAHDQVTQVRVTKTRPDGSTYDDVKSMTYDEFDRLDDVTDRGQLVDYAYDRNGNRTGVTSPGGTTTYEFDSMNRLTVAHVDGEDTTLGYGADGLLSTVTHPNGTEAKYTYDASKRIETVTHRVVSNDAVVARYVYGYDHDGNRTTEVATQHGETETSAYAFDVLGRLLGEARTQADGSIRTTSYTYEGYDRKTERVLEGGAEAVLRTYAYDAQQRLERVDVHTPGADYAVAYAYDANGNTVHREDSRHPELAVSFVYDSQDRMVEAIRGPPASEQSLGHYDYDDAGLRIRHHGGTRGDVDYLYDGGSVLEERNAGDASLRAHYRYAHELLTVDVPGQARSTYHHDALGSTAALTGASGQTEATYRVDPFGAIRERTGSSPNRFVFTGHEHDEETGLVYMRARFYDPETGRFLTQDSVLGDPSEPPSLHRYLYANANPLRFADPSGHFPELAVARNGFSLFNAVRSGINAFDENVVTPMLRWGDSRVDSGKAGFVERQLWKSVGTYVGVGRFGWHAVEGLGALGEAVVNAPRAIASAWGDAALTAIGAAFPRLQSFDTVAEATARTTARINAVQQYGRDLRDFYGQGATEIAHQVGESASYVAGRASSRAQQVMRGVIAGRPSDIAAATETTLDVVSVVVPMGLAAKAKWAARAGRVTELGAGLGEAGALEIGSTAESASGATKIEARIASRSQPYDDVMSPELFDDHIPSSAATSRGAAQGAAAEARPTAAPRELAIDEYASLSAREDIPGQAHHLNQDAAYRDVVPTDRGVSVKLEGNAFTEPGTPHFEAHASLEKFWNQFRRGGAQFGRRPTNLEYTRALLQSLRDASLPEDQIRAAVQAAIRQRVEWGLLGGDSVPRIPGRINQKRMR